MTDNVEQIKEVVKEESNVELMGVEEKPETITVEDVKAKGWSAKEIESAQKRGMIEKPEEKKEVVADQKAEPVKEEKPKSSLPDFTIDDPVKEKVFLETFGAGTPQRAMYFRMKNERQARQRAQAELNAEKARAAEMEARLKALESSVKQEVDEEGNIIDPDEKPLTLKQYRAMQKLEQEEMERASKAQGERLNIVTEAQLNQEEYAKSVLPDWEDTANKAAEVMKNLETLIPEKWKQEKAVKLIRELQVAAHNADKLELDGWNAAMIAHEIGQLHPEYGKKKEEKKDLRELPKDPKANGGHTPEQMKRIEEQNLRRASSASIPGASGRRSVDAEEVTAADLNAMSYEKRLAFRTKHPERYAKLIRG